MTLKTLPMIQPPSNPNPNPNPNPFSWLFLNRRRRILFLTLCSPVLLPLLCLSFPLVFLTHLYICLHRRLSRRVDDGAAAGRLRRCEEGRGDGEEGSEEREIGWMLLQRYLEDQLGLVGSAVYDCGGGDDDEDEEFGNLTGCEISDSKRPLLIASNCMNLVSS